MPLRILKKDEDNNREKGLKKSKMLSGGQAKLDKNKNNKLDAQDFKILRAEKAKGRGQGLQDEKMKPGKIMKAKRGMESKLTKFAKKKGLPVPLGKTFGKTIGVLPAVTTAPGSMASKAEAMKKTKGAGLKKLAKVATGRAGAIGALLGAGAVGLNMAGRKLKKVLDERKARKRDTAKVKKMGGGMMQKPMGYKSGKSIKVKCKLGKNKPTKMY